MAKLFVTGATGYIGGDALQAIVSAHPEYQITCLARDEAKGRQITNQFPNVKVVIGNLDSSNVLESESAAADIVCHWANADHEGAAISIIKGLSSRSDHQPGFLIHTSGTGILMFHHLANKIEFGDPSDKIFDDLDGISEVTSLPDPALHRKIDKIVLAAGLEYPAIKTAIVCPPAIYGVGRGPANRRSYQIPELAKATLKQGQGIQVGKGESRWAFVHVHDLSQLFLQLVEEAVKGGGNATWSPTEGYYFAESEDNEWGDVAKKIAELAVEKGFIEDRSVRSVSFTEADQICSYSGYLWGANSRSRALRARKLLRWHPTSPSVREELSNALDIEAKALGH